jgi:hypothetical protein
LRRHDFGRIRRRQALGARYSDGTPVARRPCDANSSIAMAVKASATNEPACCTAVPAVLASPRFQGVPAGSCDVPGDRNSLLNSNGLRRPPATAVGL